MENQQNAPQSDIDDGAEDGGHGSETNWLDLPSVVVATTGGPECDVAIMAAHQWAKAQRTRLVVYHSVVGHGGTGTGTERNLHRRRITEELSLHVQQLTRRRPRQVKVVVDSAPVAVGILRCAQMNNAGIVMMGPSDGSADGIGSRVLRRSRVPVMLARNSGAVRRMLVVADPGYTTSHVLDAARNFARPLRAQLTMVNPLEAANDARGSGSRTRRVENSAVEAVENALRTEQAGVVVVNAAAWPLEGGSAPQGRRLLASATASNIVWAPEPMLAAG